MPGWGSAGGTGGSGARDAGSGPGVPGRSPGKDGVLSLALLTWLPPPGPRGVPSIKAGGQGGRSRPATGGGAWPWAPGQKEEDAIQVET